MSNTRLALLAAGLLLIFVVSSRQALAGSGTVVSGSPARLNISVLFTYDEKNPQAWKTMFDESSKLLYQSTQRQMQLGTVTVYVNTPQMRASADIIINNDEAGGRAFVLGLGRRNYPATFSQVHASTSGDALGQLGFVHEMGHYMFGLYDEYLGARRLRTVTSTTPLVESPAKDFWCIRPQSGGTTCIMDAGTRTASRFRTFFCDATNHVKGYLQSDLVNDFNQGTLFVTEQQLYRGKSCWDYMVQLCKERYGVTLASPNGKPSSSTEGLQPITYVVADASPRLVLCLDRTVGAVRMAEMKAAASSLLDGLRLGGKVAVVTFGSASKVDVPLTLLSTDADRTTVRNVINALTEEASATAAMGDGMRAALDVLVAATPRSGDETVMLVRGSTAVGGADAEAVAKDMAERSVLLSYVGIGPDVDLVTLGNLAKLTGGDGSAATKAGEVAESMEEEARETQGDFQIMGTSHEVAAGGTAGGTVLIDSLARDVSFHVGWMAGDFDLSLFDPSGNAIDFGAPNVEYQKSEFGVSVRITGAPAGTWRYVVTSRGGAGQVDFQAYSSDSVTGIGYEGAGSEVTFPEPFRIAVTANSPNGPLAGADVTAKVWRPDGSVVSLTLYDDGCQGHGDERAGDGIYSNWFGAYSGNGIHTVEVTVVNRTGRAVPADEGDTPPASDPVPSFMRQESFSFEAVGVPSPLPTGTLTVTPSTVSIRSGSVRTPAQDLPVLAFHLAAGTQEAVLLRQLPISPNFVGNSVRARVARLWLDPTGTGQINEASPTQEVVMDGATGTITFSEAIFVRAGGAVDVLLTIDVASTGGTVAGWVPWIGEAGGVLPLLAMLLLGASVGMLRMLPAAWRPRRHAVAAVGLLVVATWLVLPLVGCGGGGSSAPASGNSQTAPTSSLVVQASVAPERVVGLGASSGRAVPVTGQAVTGPSVTFY